MFSKVHVYRPAAGGPGTYPNLETVLTQPIKWDVLAHDYGQVIKYTTAIRTRAASTEAILACFTRSPSHPAYQAMLEIGRAQRTWFAAPYLRERDLQREIEEGLNMVEPWNVNTLILQDVPAEPEWADRRGLSPQFWTHVRPYDEVHWTLEHAWRSARPATRDA
ncbi:Tn3 family transposase [Spirillospora sp. CA-142024]|uniref:Tn3 family transposase n=1 Tax=Spirillospora sp. CA-142024 TaxID=3240036 RepID=UPI003D8A7C4A